MSNQNYGPDGQPQGSQQPGQGYGQSSPQYPGAPQGQQPPPLPNRAAPQPGPQQAGTPAWSAQNPGSQPAGQPGYSNSGYPTGQQPTAQYPAQGQPPSGTASQYPGPGGPTPPAQPGPPNYFGSGQQPPVNPGQPGYGAGSPPGGPMPPAPSKGGNGKWIAIGAVVLIVAIIAVWAFTQRSKPTDTPPPTTETTTAPLPTMPSIPTTVPTAPSAPATGSTDMEELEVGQCIQFEEVPGSTPDPSGDIAVTHEVVDCNLAGQFKWQVASVTNGPSTCPTDYQKYYQSGFLGSEFTNLSICVAPFFDVGVCYGVDPLTDDWTEIGCTDSEAYFKVESELVGTDTSPCSLPDYAMPLPDPAPGKTYCLIEPS